MIPLSWSWIYSASSNKFYTLGMKCEYYAKEKGKFLFFSTTHSDKIGISIRWSRIHLCDKAEKNNFVFEELKKSFWLNI